MQTLSPKYFAVWSSKTNSLFSIDKIPLLFSTENKALRFLAKLESKEWRAVKVKTVMADYVEIMGEAACLEWIKS